MFVMKKTNVITKNSELTRVLNTHLQGRINLARLKLISHFVIALYKVQTVTFEKPANAFDTESSYESSLRCIPYCSSCFQPTSQARQTHTEY